MWGGGGGCKGVCNGGGDFLIKSNNPLLGFGKAIAKTIRWRQNKIVK